MDPPLQPQPQIPFFPFPTATISTAAVHTAAPALTTAQISPEVSQNHVDNFSPTVTQTLNHPSYSDMIYAAITALKERDGSSKRAIAKYIERAFTGLPPTHSALLTQHLKRLKNSGLLVMVKKSYMMPRSESTMDNGVEIPAAAAPVDPYPAPPAAVSVSSPSGPKRGRGRPPKPKPDYSQSDLISSPQPNEVTVPLPPPTNSEPVTVPIGLSISSQPNIAPASATVFTDSAVPANNVPNSVPDSHLQMLGKRRPGRPKKAPGQPGVLSVVNTSVKRRGRPPKSMSIGVKKSPGRPRKPKSVGVKKNPKRLPKSVIVPYATAAAAVHNSSPRPRGRPRKAATLTAPVGGFAMVLPAKRQGRPPKVAGIGQPKMRGRPVGRPKKNANMSRSQSQSQSQSQADSNGDLKRKFEVFQSRVKQAVSLLRPTLNSETAITAIAAIQDLEEIAMLDLNAPLREEAPLSQLPQLLQQPLGQGTVIHQTWEK